MGAISVAEVVKSTLGPKGMDKILQSTDRAAGVRVTNDGATILRSLHIDNPAAKLLIDTSKAQDEEVGDGTTSVTVLAGELLRRAERLLLEQSIHPQTVIEGFRIAASVAGDALKSAAKETQPQTVIEGFRIAASVAGDALKSAAKDNAGNEEKFREDLLRIARTTLSSKVVSLAKEHFAQLCVDAVLRLKGSNNLEMINVIKSLGGTLTDSYLEPGFLLEKKVGMGQPRVLEEAKIMVANTSMDADKIKVFGAKVQVESVSALAEIEKAEKQKMKNKVDKILAHGIHCFINRQLIYNYPEELFAQAGVMAIEHADFEGVERLAKALGADVCSTFDNTEGVTYGFAKRIDEVMIGEDTVIRFSGLRAGEACTVVLRGTSQHILDEAERSIHDALCVLCQTVQSTKTVLGAGASEMLMSTAVESEARRTPGKKALAMDAFAEALRMLPMIIAENAGLDSTELITKLRAAHTEGRHNMGLDIQTGDIADVMESGILECYKVKDSVLRLAAEAAEVLLRVDTVMRATPRQRSDY
eukprot:CAMPEP_0201503686 /NCGR_PEP_ID=MMETSP0151_2-20130828/84802_1 /ASSEMBLY_ACC=CAM_ASM_000257 /TAXON_ID=200890 /ORGANISM="Paramoeba atlantica, Strain 621/1 / CCAP 1560/9" /LENGTH=530 /DNA_ID=CAMNT_0047897371 /DNA_START=15 /DNA_END=1608 /DNA_ORIENTATION=-